MGFLNEMKDEMKNYGAGSSSGDYLEFDEPGIYQMRALVQPKTIAYHFPLQGRPDVCVGIEEGCQHHGADDKKPTIRLVTYVIDRSDGKVKRAELPLSVSYSINALQEDADFAFTEFPMPYDIKIKYDPKNPDPKSKYTVTPSPKMEPVTDEEQVLLDEAMKKQTPEQFVEMKKKFQKGGSGKSPERIKYDTDAADDIASSIPF